MSEKAYFQLLSGVVLILFGVILTFGYIYGDVPDSETWLHLVFPVIPLIFLFTGPFRNHYMKGISDGSLLGLLIACVIMFLLIYYTSQQSHSDDRFAWLFLLSPVFLFLPGLITGAFGGAIVTFFLSFKRK